MRIPSIKTLSSLRYGNREKGTITTDDAKRIRSILTSGKNWHECITLVNDVLQGFGVTGWYKCNSDELKCSCTYVNFGDPYDITLCFVEEHPRWSDGWRVMSWGDVAESCE